MGFTRPTTAYLLQKVYTFRGIFSKSRKYHITSKLRDAPGEGPIQYSKTKAYNYRAMETFEGPTRDVPFYQPFSVVISTAAFLLYFCYLREENDLDEEIATSLFDKIPGLEEKQLLLMIDHEKSVGKSTEALQRRLNELQTEKRNTNEIPASSQL